MEVLETQKARTSILFDNITSGTGRSNLRSTSINHREEEDTLVRRQNSLMEELKLKLPDKVPRNMLLD